MTKDIGLGIIGIAAGADVMALNSDPTSRLKLSALCDPNARAARALAERFEIPFVTTDPIDLVSHAGIDAVAICGSVEERFGHCMAALSAGKRVLCGVPMASTVEQARELAAEADRFGGSLMVANPYRWQREMAAIRGLAAAGELGEITFVQTEVSVGAASGKAGAWELATSVDLLRWTGGEIVSVCARSADSAITAHVQFANGGIGLAVIVRVPDGLASEGMTLNVVGTEGAVLNGRIALNRLKGLPAMTFAAESAGSGDLLGSVREFEASLTAAESAPWDAWDGVRLVAVCAAIEESFRTGLPAAVTESAAKGEAQHE
jgi:predicted dehydrogenase